jgi:hypothetical protein
MKNHFFGSGRFLAFDYDWGFINGIGLRKADLDRATKRPETFLYWEGVIEDAPMPKHATGWCRWCRVSLSQAHLPPVQLAKSLEGKAPHVLSKRLAKDSLLHFLLGRYPSIEGMYSSALGRRIAPEYLSETHHGAQQMALVERSVLEGVQFLLAHINSCIARHGESQVLVQTDTSSCNRWKWPVPCMTYAVRV